MKNRILLLKTFLLATSKRNFLKHSDDKMKRSQVYGNMIGFGIVYFMLFAYLVATSIGMGTMGFAEAIPNLCASTIVLLAFVFTLLKTNGYLFGFKEYDVLVSMPFEIKDIVSAKFLYMYVKTVPVMFAMSLAMMVGYILGTGFDIVKVLVWVILSLFVPVTPMIIASFLGALIVRIGAGFRHKNLIQTILIFVLIIPCFFIRFIIEKIFKDNQVEVVVESIADKVTGSGRYIPMVSWFEKSVNDKSIASILLLTGCSIILFELFFLVVSKSYRKINSSLSVGAARKKHNEIKTKKQSIVKSIAFKEFKRMSGSTVYITNVGMGVVLAVLLGVVSLFVSAESIVATITEGAPIDSSAIIPAIPLVVFFVLGMASSTACSPSLEGKNYWIIKSFPIDPMDDCKGKILFNLYLTIPFGVFSTLALCYCFRTSLFEALLSVIAVSVMCLFSSVFGLRCGLKHRKLDWDNEVEVVKQGAGMTSYLLPNMFLSMFLVVGVVALGIVLNYVYVFVIEIALYAVFTLLSWKGVRKYANR